MAGHLGQYFLLSCYKFRIDMPAVLDPLLPDRCIHHLLCGVTAHSPDPPQSKICPGAIASKLCPATAPNAEKESWESSAERQSSGPPPTTCTVPLRVRLLLLRLLHWLPASTSELLADVAEAPTSESAAVDALSSAFCGSRRGPFVDAESPGSSILAGIIQMRHRGNKFDKAHITVRADRPVKFVEEMPRACSAESTSQKQHQMAKPLIARNIGATWCTEGQMNDKEGLMQGLDCPKRQARCRLARRARRRYMYFV